METNSPRITFYKDNDFHFEYEIADNVIGLHAKVNRISHNKLKDWYSILNTFLYRVREAGEYQIFSVSPNPKFCELMGGRYVKSIIGPDGKQYEVYQWANQQ
jgi:hypothetical protein